MIKNQQMIKKSNILKTQESKTSNSYRVWICSK
jgi:hypothetical protein